MRLQHLRFLVEEGVQECGVTIRAEHLLGVVRALGTAKAVGERDVQNVV